MLAVAAASLALHPARFPARAGWRTGSQAVHACPGVAPTRCESATTWAATVRWRDCVDCIPHRTLAHLPPSGIALQLTVARERPPRLADEGWPPRLTPRDALPGLEGVPRRIAVYQHRARVRGVEVTVAVFFGRPQPTAAMLARAEAELRSARFR